MENNTASRRDLLFQYHGIPPVGTSVSLALQHLVAMIVGCVTPAIIIAGAVGLSQADRVLLIQTSLVMSGVSTLLQLFPIGGRFGSGLPVILGVSFAYVPSMQAIAASGGGVAAIAGAMLVGGIIAVLVGVFVKKIRLLFPPVITGTVVFTIGLSLYPTAINYMAGGTANTYETVTSQGLPESLVYGSWQNWLIAILTLAAVIILNNYGKGTCKLASILLGMIFGYIVALCFGMVDFSDIGVAAWFALPQPLHFGISFDFSSCVALGLLFAINSIQAIGDFTATTVGGFDREPTDRELQGGIIAYGVSNILGAFLGGLPTATYSQNVGIVTTNKVVNRTVFTLAGVFLFLAGVSPKFAAVLTTIPQCVLGGATITVFSTIAMTGMKLIASQALNARNTTIVGLSAALGVGISQASSALSQFPDSVTMIFGKSPVVIATLMAVLLNLVLPKEDKKFRR
jgi:NCS2 family nucleobase:cation symporter-2